MAPNQNSVAVNSSNDDGSTLVNRSNRIIKDRPNKQPYDTKPGEKPYELEIVWRNVLAFIYLHAGAVYAFFGPTPQTPSYFITFVFAIIGSYGISSGAHRLWCHKCYKANKKMKAMLLFFQTVAFQNSVIEWVRDHRVHHKFSDTNADPHNASRGFFFSHMGWLMCKKHPDVRKYGAKVDMNDLESDPVLRFQHKYYAILMPLASFVLPVYLCTLFGEPIMSAYHWQLFRYVLTLHITWSINSVSHIWGGKPFEKDIAPTDTYIIGFLAFGEGWHNYHHVYPWDYKVSELPRYWCNFSIPFLDFFAWLGWATDLKTVSDEMIRKRVMRTGDGSHKYSTEAAAKKTAKELLDTFNNNNNQSEQQEEEEEHVDTLWGWGDDDMDAEEIKDVKILHPKFGL